MSKPIILAIMGPSASGKDSLARALSVLLEENFIWHCLETTSNRIVSDTTRPPRPGEQDKWDYNFITQREFARRELRHEYIETYEFGPQRWMYGTPKNQLKADINIGVFSPSGFDSIEACCSDGYDIIPVLLDAPRLKRLWRSIRRDHGLRREHLRRMFQDSKDFAHPDRYLKYDRSIDLRSSNLSVDGAARKVYNILCGWDILHTT